MERSPTDDPWWVGSSRCTTGRAERVDIRVGLVNYISPRIAPRGLKKSSKTGMAAHDRQPWRPEGRACGASASGRKTRKRRSEMKNPSRRTERG